MFSSSQLSALLGVLFLMLAILASSLDATTTEASSVVTGTTKPRFKQGFQLTRGIILVVVIFAAIYGPIFSIQLLASRAKRLHAMCKEMSAKSKEQKGPSNESVELMSSMVNRGGGGGSLTAVPSAGQSQEQLAVVASGSMSPRGLKRRPGSSKSSNTGVFKSAADLLKPIATSQSLKSIPKMPSRESKSKEAVPMAEKPKSSLPLKVEAKSIRSSLSAKSLDPSGKTAISFIPKADEPKTKSLPTGQQPVKSVKSNQTSDFKIEAKDHVLKMDPLMDPLAMDCTPGRLGSNGTLKTSDMAQPLLPPLPPSVKKSTQ